MKWVRFGSVLAYELVLAFFGEPSSERVAGVCPNLGGGCQLDKIYC